MPFSATAAATATFVTGRTPVVDSHDGTLVAQRFTVTLTPADLVSGTVGAVGILPALHIPVAIEVDADQLDSNGSPALIYSVGLLNSTQTAIDTSTSAGGAAWATGLTVGRTAGGAASGFITSRPIKLVQESTTTDRYVGVSITTSAATAVAGTFAITLYYKPGPV